MQSIECNSGVTGPWAKLIPQDGTGCGFADFTYDQARHIRRCISLYVTADATQVTGQQTSNMWKYYFTGTQALLDMLNPVNQLADDFVQVTEEKTDRLTILDSGLGMPER